MREHLALSQQAFAELLYDLEAPEVPEDPETQEVPLAHNLASAISKVEKGRQLPPTKMLAALGEIAVANGRRVSSDYILWGQENHLVKQLCSLPIYHVSKQQGEFFKACAVAANEFRPDLVLNQKNDITYCAQRFRYIRKSRGLLQGCFGFDDSCTSRNELSKELPNVNYLRSFCAKFGVSADYILFGTYPSLPVELADLLLAVLDESDDMLFGFTYETQQCMLRLFCDISSKFF